MGTLGNTGEMGVRPIILFLVLSVNSHAIAICTEIKEIAEEPKVGTLREVSPRREPKVGKLLDLNLVRKHPLLYPDTTHRPIEIDSAVFMSSDPKYIGKDGRIRRLVDSLIPEVKKQICTHAPVCGKGSDFLRGMLKRTYDVDTVMMKNTFHYFLEIPNFFPDGTPLVIDPTFRQFIDSDKREQVPEIFVGTRSEFLEVLKNNGGELYIKGHFSNLKNWTEEQEQALQKARQGLISPQ